MREVMENLSTLAPAFSAREWVNIVEEFS